MSDTLKSYKSKSGRYLIPVSWSMYSTIIVEADNLEEAVKIAKEKADDLPLCRPDCSEYVDGSYNIDIDDDEDAINAQDYKTIGNVEITKNGEIVSFNRVQSIK